MFYNRMSWRLVFAVGVMIRCPDVIYLSGVAEFDQEMEIELTITP